MIKKVIQIFGQEVRKSWLRLRLPVCRLWLFVPSDIQSLLRAVLPAVSINCCLAVPLPVPLLLPSLHKVVQQNRAFVLDIRPKHCSVASELFEKSFAHVTCLEYIGLCNEVEQMLNSAWRLSFISFPGSLPRSLVIKVYHYNDYSVAR